MPARIVKFSLTVWNPAMLAGLAVSQVTFSWYEALAAAFRDRASDGLEEIDQVLNPVRIRFVCF